MNLNINKLDVFILIQSIMSDPVNSQPSDPVRPCSSLAQ